MNIIRDTDALRAYCDAARKQDFVCIDTEFMRESTFFSILCLVQVATAEEDAIIDPIAEGIDLTPLKELLLDESVIKVLHAARQDMEIFYRICDAVPGPIFDTQIAGMALGMGDSAGYSALYPGVVEELEDKGRLNWVTEEMAQHMDESLYTFEPEEAWKRLKLRGNKRPYLAALKAAAAWRERQAIKKDIPRRRVLKDDAMYDLAQQRPRTIEALAKLRGIPRGFEKSSTAGGLVDSIAAAVDNAADYAPPAPKVKHMPPSLGPRIEMLKTLLRLRTEVEGIATRLVANAKDIEQLAAFGERAEIQALTGWRREIFGQDALDMLRGKIALRLEGENVVAERLD